MEHLFRPLFRGLAWNTIESIVYQAMLIMHYLLLYRHTESSLFGMISVLFSTLYLMTFIVNGGFDMSLAPHARSLNTNGYFWQNIIAPNLIIQCILYALVGTIGIGINYYWIPESIRLSLLASITLALLLITETTKKSMRSLMHLTFNNQVAALVEVGSLALYMALVWIGYWYYTNIFLTLVFVPLLITSALSCLILGWYLYEFYYSLPTQIIPLPTTREIMRTRLYTYGTQLGHTILSSNVVVPFCALHIGLHQAGLFKLISTITHTITSIVRTIFGPTSQAIFSHTVDRSRHEQQRIFFTLTEHLHHALYGFIIFFSINYTKFFMSFDKSTLSPVLPLIILFLCIQLTEHLYIVYEKFFIAHNRASYICTLSICSVILIGALFFLPLHLSPSMLMSIALLIRMSALGVMGIVAYYIFHIQPAFTLRIDYLSYGFGIALFFFICF